MDHSLCSARTADSRVSQRAMLEILAPKAESSQNREWCQPDLDPKAHRGLSGKGYLNDPARTYTSASALPKRNSGSGAFEFSVVAIGSGLWETVDMAKPTGKTRSGEKQRKTAQAR